MTIPARHCNSPRIVVLAAVAALAAAARPSVYADPGDPDRSPSMRLTLAASGSGDVAATARIEAGGAEIRLFVSGDALSDGDSATEADPRAYPAAGLAMSLPGLRMGAVKPQGLAAFIYAPGAAGFLLAGAGVAPLALDDPAEPACVGASVGGGCGAFIAAPAASPAAQASTGAVLDGERPAGGAWLSTPGGRVAGLAMASSSPADPGGPGWYDAPSPRAERYFVAVTASADGVGWTAAAAAAASADFPGRDAAACRVEGRAALGPLRLEGTASAASGAWAGPTGRVAPALRLAADARYARRCLSASLGCRIVRADAASGEPADVSVSGAAEVAAAFGLLKASACLSPAVAGSPSALELETRLRPGFVPWLNLATSWRAEDAAAVRFDLCASASFGKRTRLSLDSGFRLIPEGRRIRGGVSVERAGAGLALSASIKTDGWIEADGDWTGALGCAVKATVTLR